MYDKIHYKLKKIKIKNKGKFLLKKKKNVCIRAFTTRRKNFSFFILYVYEMTDISWTYCDNHLTIYVNQTKKITFFPFVVYSLRCVQLGNSTDCIRLLCLWSFPSEITGVSPTPGDLLNPRIVPTSPALSADFLPLSHGGKPFRTWLNYYLTEQWCTTPEASTKITHLFPRFP